MLIAFSVTPIGAGEDVGEIVAEAVRVVRASGLPNRTDAMFTSVEGEWDEVMDVVKAACDAVAAACLGKIELPVGGLHPAHRVRARQAGGCGASHADRDIGRGHAQALYEPPDQQGVEIMRQPAHQAAHQVERQPGIQHGLAAQRVGQRPRHQLADRHAGREAGADR